MLQFEGGFYLREACIFSFKFLGFINDYFVFFVFILIGSIVKIKISFETFRIVVPQISNFRQGIFNFMAKQGRKCIKAEILK